MAHDEGRDRMSLTPERRLGPFGWTACSHCGGQLAVPPGGSACFSCRRFQDRPSGRAVLWDLVNQMAAVELAQGEEAALDLPDLVADLAELALGDEESAGD